MRLLALLIPLCIGCAATQQAQPAEKLPETAEPQEPLNSYQCSSEEFRGFGAGETESEALNIAYSELAKQINSSVKVTTEYTMSQQRHNGSENLSSDYESKTLMKSDLLNAHDARVARKKRNGNKIAVTVCMSRKDAAKPYIQMQSLLLDSLGFIAANELKATHPKQKSQARNKANAIWIKMLANSDLFKSWGVESGINAAKDLHDAIEDDYKDYCQTAKLHWSAESETPYSEIAFSKLSGSIKMEKSQCFGRGISLAYKGAEPECSIKFGLNTCSYSQSLSVYACDGTEYLQLKNEVTGAHQKPDFALEKVGANLKSADFWRQWIEEIKQWSPQCQ